MTKAKTGESMQDRAGDNETQDTGRSDNRQEKRKAERAQVKLGKLGKNIA